MPQTDLNHVLERLSQQDQMMGKMIALQQSTEKKVDGLVYTLDGNGKPGLKALVDRHQVYIGRRQWLEKALITAFIGVVVSASAWGASVLLKADAQQKAGATQKAQ